MESLAMTDADFVAELSETEQATAKAESLVSDGDSDAEALPDMESLRTLQAELKARAIEEKFGNLIRNPALAETYPFDSLMGHEWVWLLCEAPQFGDRCKWDVLVREIYFLVRRMPEFKPHFSPDKLREVAKISIKDIPKLIKHTR